MVHLEQFHLIKRVQMVVLVEVVDQKVVALLLEEVEILLVQLLLKEIMEETVFKVRLNRPEVVVELVLLVVQEQVVLLLMVVLVQLLQLQVHQLQELVAVVVEQEVMVLLVLEDLVEEETHQKLTQTQVLQQ